MLSEATRSIGMLDISPEILFSTTRGKEKCLVLNQEVFSMLSEATRSIGMLDLKPAGGFSAYVV